MPSEKILCTTVSVHAAVQLLAMAGDLSMGQPTDQSARSARLAGRLALLDGAGDEAAMHARLVALLRWSGCTANAAGFAVLLGDDVAGRDAMLRNALPAGHPLTFANIEPLARIHCEVAGDLAGMLGLPSEVEAGLRHVWEHYDGGGAPQQLRAPAIPAVVYYTSLAGDLEILARTHDAQAAMRMILGWADAKYPAALTALAAEHADTLLAALDGPDDDGVLPTHEVALSIVADLVELKLPWLAGYSRRVAELAGRAAALAGMPAEQQTRLVRAALVHGVGRASVANTIWERAAQPSRADWEKIHLAPYWTARAGALVPALRDEAALASHMYERLDGSGYFRGLAGDALDMPQRLLAAAGIYAALCAPRPWRAALSPQQAAQLLEEQGQAGRLDAAAAGFVIAAAGGEAEGNPVPARKGLLSEREVEVLRRISLGESNKEAARVMQISPSTVRTHMESIFRKLGCSTRAAATLKGLTLGLI